MRNKRGSHVGFVISFVIFITFLVFLYAILQPTITRERSKVYVLDYLSFNLINASSSEVTTLTINVLGPTGTGNQNCLNMQSFPEIPDEEKDNLLFKDISDVVFPYEVRGNGDVWIETGTDFVGIITVFYSEDLNSSPLSTAQGCNPKSNTIGVVKTITEVLEGNIIELKDKYIANYEGLKDDLGIPEGTEFSFKLLS